MLVETVARTPQKEQRVRVVLFNHFPDGDAASVRLDEVLMVGLELLYLFRCLITYQAGAICVQTS